MVRMFLTLLVVALILIIGDALVAKVVLIEISRAHAALTLAVLMAALSIVQLPGALILVVIIRVADVVAELTLNAPPTTSICLDVATMAIKALPWTKAHAVVLSALLRAGN